MMIWKKTKGTSDDDLLEEEAGGPWLSIRMSRGEKIEARKHGAEVSSLN